jgi:hypothetical protein
MTEPRFAAAGGAFLFSPLSTGAREPRPTCKHEGTHCDGSAEPPAWDPRWSSTPLSPGGYARWSPPEILETMRRQLGVTHRVCWMFLWPRYACSARVSWPALARGVAAAVPQHVQVHRERHVRPRSNPAEQRVKSLRRHRRAALGHEHVRGCPCSRCKRRRARISSPWSVRAGLPQGIEERLALTRGAPLRFRLEFTVISGVGLTANWRARSQAEGAKFNGGTARLVTTKPPLQSVNDDSHRISP